MSGPLSIEVVKPGLLSTFQDLGRRGQQHLGVPLNGVMDERAHRTANWLVGNAPGAATLEMTLLGPNLRFGAPVRIALSGADLSATLNGQPVPLNEAVQAAAGDVLAFGAPKRGIRAYLAVEGGYALEPVMGSMSTNVRAGFGGLGGKPLRKDVSIPLSPAPGRTLPVRGALPAFAADIMREPDAPLRVMAGREHDMFTQESLRAFGAEAYQITPQSDRMGYRLKGPPLERRRTTEMLSEAVTAGTVQVPPDGQPIVLMADCQTSGGYPRIAHVAWVDLPRLAQCAPGARLRFEWIDLAEAQRLAVSQARVFGAMENGTA
ncbi:biotin-dependent carboxyltransferase family protein [Aquabacter cavernae]|uniref:5-oxoprolinase subunit C family protein n=1 Tax=Aquabacter cavernae TaxID=2496029 RepID=UPI00196A78D8|nr:biotin-dependent carboxyltransferase family protein [Aquabacter cavernae]